MFKNYLLTAYKVFMRRKLFTAINLLCIVLTLLVLIVAAALIENAFYPKGVEGKSERFLQVMTLRAASPDGSHVRTAQLGYKLIDKYLKPMPSLEAVAAVTKPGTVSIYQDGRVSQLQMRHADAQYWRILDFKLVAGRLPTADDEALGRMVAVLNASSATRLFGATAAVGQPLNVGNQTLRIIGVVEDAQHLNAYADIWAPITTLPSSDYRQKFFGNFTALLLARSAADLPQTRNEVRLIAASVEFDDPKKWRSARFWADSKLDLAARTLLKRGKEADSGAATLLALTVAVMGVFMLLPALNLVNLNSGRILERSAEIGVRKAFGATSAQLAGQLVVENVLLCLVGGALGLLGAKLALLGIEQSGLIPYLQVSVNLAVAGWALLITLVFGLLSGVLPAWTMSRLDPVHALKGTI